MNNQSTYGAITCGTPSLFSSTIHYDGNERRRHKRVPRCLGIVVQPLNDQQSELSEPFFAITRDISRGGLSFVSSQKCTFELASISIENDPTKDVICAVRASNLIVASEVEDVYLTCVEFIYERCT